MTRSPQCLATFDIGDGSVVVCRLPRGHTGDHLHDDRFGEIAYITWGQDE